ncbi:hypothetical protein MKW98_000627 [Papaver atlanticum]|uniref:SANT domain-containing protein n=1 Tax=Papaver atlanticum TaxID=357466 RepID=A0AAD4S407_9MAGN|nr:hypothetical protein MKW98_000627 [Papaver atlanticum]
MVNNNSIPVSAIFKAVQVSNSSPMESFASEMDLDDLLSEPVVVNSRARVKFQPKARPKSNLKVATVSASGQCDSTKDKPDALSGTPQLGHALSSTEALQQECSVSAGGKISGLVDVSTQLATRKDEIAIDPMFLGNTNTLDICGDKQAGFERSRGETADIFSELESLDTLSQSAISNMSTMRKFQPKMIINAPPRNKHPASRPIIGEAACSISCRDTPSHQGYTISEGGLASIASAPTASVSPSVNNNPDFLVVPQDVFNSREAASSDNHGDRVSWMDDRRLEKEVEAFDNFTSESTPTIGNVVNESLEEDLTPACPQDGFTDFSKKLAPGLEKTGSGCRKAAEGSETLNKEPPKKKFSHSTRRNKRRVDKGLLETPEDEINPRKLMLKDLILLAEAKERLLVADPNAANNSSPYQSTTVTQDTHFEEEVPFAYEEDQAERYVQPKLNYHTFMNKTSTERWSKQDTDLFYEGIQQFGTDFTLIQQLFPERARAQVKSKYKKEEQQHPKRLFDALTNRSKNHSHFEMVIERLQKAAADAEAEHGSDRDDEPVGITGEEVEITPNTNEEVSKKPDENETNFGEEEVGEGLMEAEQVAIMNHQGHSPAKSHQESEEGDVYDIWSEYKSDI